MVHHDPAAMPAGTYLDFVFMEDKAVLFSLVDGWPKDCVPVTALPPSPAGDGARSTR